MEPLMGLRDSVPDWPARLAGLWPDRIALIDPESGAGKILRAQAGALLGRRP